MARKRKHSGSKHDHFNPLPWVAGALFVLGIAILAGLYWKRMVVVNEVRYAGNYFVPVDVLEQNVSVPTGVHPDSLDYLKLIEEAEKIDYVKRAAVKVEPGGSLTIEVVERTPVAMIADGEHKTYVDEEGVRLPIKLGKAVDVPILYGFAALPAGDTLRSEAWQQVRSFLIEMHNNPVGSTTISEIAWTKEQGVVALSHVREVKLIFGKADFSSKLRNWEAFYTKVIRKKGMEKMKSIDLRFKGQIVTRES